MDTINVRIYPRSKNYFLKLKEDINNIISFNNRRRKESLLDLYKSNPEYFNIKFFKSLMDQDFKDIIINDDYIEIIMFFNDSYFNISTFLKMSQAYRSKIKILIFYDKSPKSTDYYTIENGKIIIYSECYIGSDIPYKYNPNILYDSFIDYYGDYAEAEKNFINIIHTDDDINPDDILKSVTIIDRRRKLKKIINKK